MEFAMELAPSGLKFFEPRRVTAGQSAADPRVQDKAKKERGLFCALCRHPTTHQDERIEVNGRHEHRCTNPAGYTFAIGCFHEAGGCIGIGTATEAHTWFKSYAWKIALCASCERHLGWRFVASADYFHGLILDRLTAVGGARH
jgi:hypothetical protein